MRMRNPDAAFNYMMATIPEFADFINKNRGKSIEQIASDYNVDANVINRLLGK